MLDYNDSKITRKILKLDTIEIVLAMVSDLLIFWSCFPFFQSIGGGTTVNPEQAW